MGAPFLEPDTHGEVTRFPLHDVPIELALAERSRGQSSPWFHRVGSAFWNSPDQCGARIMGAVALTPTRSGSGEADIARASQVQHTIEDVGGDVHLGRPTLIRVRAQPVADHLFPSA